MVSDFSSYIRPCFVLLLHDSFIPHVTSLLHNSISLHTFHIYSSYRYFPSLRFIFSFIPSFSYIIYFHILHTFTYTHSSLISHIVMASPHWLKYKTFPLHRHRALLTHTASFHFSQHITTRSHIQISSDSRHVIVNFHKATSLTQAVNARATHLPLQEGKGFKGFSLPVCWRHTLRPEQWGLALPAQSNRSVVSLSSSLPAQPPASPHTLASAWEQTGHVSSASSPEVRYSLSSYILSCFMAKVKVTYCIHDLQVSLLKHTGLIPSSHITDNSLISITAIYLFHIEFPPFLYIFLCFPLPADRGAFLSISDNISHFTYYTSYTTIEHRAGHISHSHIG